jgi:hypothetical protein
MVRPSFASLNLFAKVLREANPVYEECGHILNEIIGLAPTHPTELRGNCPSELVPASSQERSPTPSKVRPLL